MCIFDFVKLKVYFTFIHFLNCTVKFERYKQKAHPRNLSVAETTRRSAVSLKIFKVIGNYTVE